MSSGPSVLRTLMPHNTHTHTHTHHHFASRCKIRMQIIQGMLSKADYLYPKLEESESVSCLLCCAVLCLVAQSCPALCDSMDCSPPRLLCPWDFPGKNTGVCCHFFLQGIFPGLESLSLRSPALAGGFFSTTTIWETLP